jgi:hypothetical protein
MSRLIFATALAAAASLASAAYGQTPTSAVTTAPVGIRVVEPVGFGVVSDLFLPSIPNIGGMGGASGFRNAALTIFGRSGAAVSMAVPTSFRVIRSGGTEALTVITNTNVELGLESNQLLGGDVLSGGTMSVNVGGVLAVASSDRLVPGPYEGMMVVVVQYN